MKRWRGVVLELVYDGHCKQQSRLDVITLWGIMRDLSHDISRNEVITILQQLGERRLIRFRQSKDDTTGNVQISEIELTAAGSDLVEKISPADPAISLL